MLIASIGADNLVRVLGLTDQSTGNYVNDRTITWAIKTRAGVLVSGASGTMTYIAGSNGNYQSTLDDSVVLVEDAVYVLEITVAGSPKGFSRDKVIALYLRGEG